MGMFTCAAACARARPCVPACVYVKVPEVSKGPNITQIKTCILLFMGWLFVPVSFEQLRGFVRARGCGVGGGGGGERKKASTTWRQIFAFLKAQEDCSLLSCIYPKRTGAGGGGWKRPESCAFLCVCVSWPLRSAPNIHNECLSPYWPPHQKHE